MTTRKSAKWMQQIDERILEHLQKEHSSTPSLMASKKWIQGSEEEIRRHCERLCQAELAWHIIGDTFGISPLGVLYLHGRITVGETANSPERMIIHGFGEDKTEELSEIFGLNERYDLFERTIQLQ